MHWNIGRLHIAVIASWLCTFGKCFVFFLRTVLHKMIRWYDAHIFNVHSKTGGFVYHVEIKQKIDKKVLRRIVMSMRNVKNSLRICKGSPGDTSSLWWFMLVCVWRGSVMVEALDLRSTGHDFQPFHLNVTSLGKLFTHVILSPSSIILILARGRWCSVAGKVTIDLASHWPCVIDSVAWKRRWAPVLRFPVKLCFKNQFILVNKFLSACN